MHPLPTILIPSDSGPPFLVTCSPVVQSKLQQIAAGEPLDSSSNPVSCIGSFRGYSNIFPGVHSPQPPAKHKLGVATCSTSLKYLNCRAVNNPFQDQHWNLVALTLCYFGDLFCWLFTGGSINHLSSFPLMNDCACILWRTGKFLQ